VEPAIIKKPAEAAELVQLFITMEIQCRKITGACVLEIKGRHLIMDRESREILNLIQTEFSLDSKPFLKIADKLNMTEQKVINTVNRLKKQGYIRRIGGIFNSNKLGYTSLLCAVEVPEHRIHEVAEFISSYKGVTHNYQRNNEYNIWFTVTAASQDKIKKFLKDIKINMGIENILELPAVDVFKINAVFSMKE
jgi:DNA-binding Lrp family transcriptional regulator